MITNKQMIITTIISFVTLCNFFHATACIYLNVIILDTYLMYITVLKKNEFIVVILSVFKIDKTGMV